ncbi:MAG: hypothetical protein JNJ49_10365 [Bdellovibrionaceae bacterium]|nr:hypothetical protein [Pseudobdellovibrionaceae bacterium]
MKKAFLISAGLSLLSTVALAANPRNVRYLLPQGGVSDGGGSAVVCRTADGSVRSAELLDLFEGRIINGHSIGVDVARPYMDIAREVAAKIDKGGVGRDLTGVSRITDSSGAVTQRMYLFGGETTFGSMKWSLESAEKMVRMLPEGVALKPVSDYTSPIIPKDCAVEQLALYQDAPNRLLIVGDIWSKLDEVNRAALMIHEALYRLLRFSDKETDSNRTRLTVALAFTSYQFELSRVQLPARVHLCNSLDSDMNYRFALYASGDRVHYEFFRFNGKFGLTRETFAQPLKGSILGGHPGSSVTTHADQMNAPILENPLMYALTVWGAAGPALSIGIAGAQAVPISCYETEVPAFVVK